MKKNERKEISQWIKGKKRNERIDFRNLKKYVGSICMEGIDRSGRNILKGK